MIISVDIEATLTNMFCKIFHNLVFPYPFNVMPYPFSIQLFSKKHVFLPYPYTGPTNFWTLEPLLTFFSFG